jgi:phosphopantothenoylcysteine decarboxylase / phosphopantothenate---cysteine ligase
MAIFTALTQALSAKTNSRISKGVFEHLWLKKAVVTAGPTFEAIDPVRGITNRSSGKMGYAIAEALRDIGMDVTLISGPTALAAPTGIKTLQVNSASQMLDAVKTNLSDVTLFFAVAAVADYTPATPKSQKMKKSGESLALALVPTVDILAKVASRPDAPFCVGFAAESENVVEYAAKKRQNKRIPMIVANHANTAIGSDDNAVTIIDDAGEHPISRASKADIAKKIVSHAAQLYLHTRQASPPKTPQTQPNNITSIKSAKHANQ